MEMVLGSRSSTSFHFNDIPGIAQDIMGYSPQSNLIPTQTDHIKDRVFRYRDREISSCY